MQNIMAGMISKFNLEAERHMERQRLNPFSGSFSRSPSPRHSNDYGKPLEGSKTEERGKKAKCHILKEVLDLCNCIHDVGVHNEITRCKEEGENYDPDHDIIVTFKEIFQIYTNINDKVVGLLIAAKKRGFIYFEKEILFQRQDDDVLIALMKPISEVRSIIKKELSINMPTPKPKKEDSAEYESDESNKEVNRDKENPAEEKINISTEEQSNNQSNAEDRPNQECNIKISNNGSDAAGEMNATLTKNSTDPDKNTPEETKKEINLKETINDNKKENIIYEVSKSEPSNMGSSHDFKGTIVNSSENSAPDSGNKLGTEIQPDTLEDANRKLASKNHNETNLELKQNIHEAHFTDENNEALPPSEPCNIFKEDLSSTEVTNEIHKSHSEESILKIPDLNSVLPNETSKEEVTKSLQEENSEESKETNEQVTNDNDVDVNYPAPSDTNELNDKNCINESINQNIETEQNSSSQNKEINRETDETIEDIQTITKPLENTELSIYNIR